MNNIINKKERLALVPYVALLLRQEQKILLIRRCNTGDCDGFYACAGGKIDGNESATQALIREAYEEIGIILKKEHLKIVHVLHSKRDIEEAIGFFIEATIWENNPCLMEPDKCDDVIWFDIDSLPQNLFPGLKQVLEMLDKNIFYSEYGWE